MDKFPVALIITIVSILVGCEDDSIFSRAKQLNEAKSLLLRVAVMEERYYLRNSTYTTDLTLLGFPVAENYMYESGTYMVNVTAADTNTFSAIATYQKADAAKVECRILSIDGSGNKTSAPRSDCWTN